MLRAAGCSSLLWPNLGAACVLAAALSRADVLLVMPQRKAPSERLQRAAAEAAGVDLPDEDEGDLRFSLRPDAAAWEKWLARFLQVC